MGFFVDVKKATWNKDVKIFSLEGQLDTKSLADMEAVIKQEKASGEKAAWVIDLTKLNYISSAGVAIFIGLGYEAEEQGGLCFFGASSKVVSVFELLGLTDVFKFYKSETDARQSSGM